MPERRRLAPEVFRQRLLVEGYYGVEVSRESLSSFLVELAAHLDLRTYGDPIVYSPADGMGKDENAGFDAFVPLVDSGISAYVWTNARFASVVLYTCKGFDEARAIAFVRDRLGLADPIATHAF